MPTAVVTGANRGIGFEWVDQLLERGWIVYAGYRKNLLTYGNVIDLSQNKIKPTKKNIEYYLKKETYKIFTENVIFGGNVKVNNFFWATLLGICPQIFLICSIGSGLEKIIDQNLSPPGIMDIIFFPDIYIPLIIFISLVVVLIFLRKKFYKK